MSKTRDNGKCPNLMVAPTWLVRNTKWTKSIFTCCIRGHDQQRGTLDDDNAAVTSQVLPVHAQCAEKTAKT